MGASLKFGTHKGRWTWNKAWNIRGLSYPPVFHRLPTQTQQDFCCYNALQKTQKQYSLQNTSPCPTFAQTKIMDKNYDIILAGAGLAGLTLALELARRPFFQNKKVLLIDREAKEKNDRTWCFWATPDESLPPVTHKTWSDCRFFGKNFSQKLDISPYRYHMVRGLDFYRWAKSELDKAPHIQRITANIQSVHADTGTVCTDRPEST